MCRARAGVFLADSLIHEQKFPFAEADFLFFFAHYELNGREKELFGQYI
jgi:hypothetical protein